MRYANVMNIAYLFVVIFVVAILTLAKSESECLPKADRDDEQDLDILYMYFIVALKSQDLVNRSQIDVDRLRGDLMLADAVIKRYLSFKREKCSH